MLKDFVRYRSFQKALIIYTILFWSRFVEGYPSFISKLGQAAAHKVAKVFTFYAVESGAGVP